MKTILIANQKGGCGKTLVVDELAFSFDRTDVKYSLYDLDGQGGIIHEPKVIDDADYAIVDTPGYISDNLGELIQGADLIIIPTRTTYKDIPTLQTMLILFAGCMFSVFPTIAVQPLFIADEPIKRIFPVFMLALVKRVPLITSKI